MSVVPDTGWNVGAAASRGPNLCSLSGSFIPFATTREEPLAAADPRKSLDASAMIFERRQSTPGVCCSQGCLI